MIRRNPAGALAIALAAVLVLGAPLAYVIRRAAESARLAQSLRRAEGLRLAATATQLAPRQPGLALLLAIEAARRQPGLLANNALLVALASCEELRAFRGPARFHDVSWSGAGDALVAACADGTVRRFDAATGRDLGAIRGPWGPLLSARVDREGARVLVADTEGRAVLWDLARELPIRAWRFEGTRTCVAAASPDFRAFVVLNDDDTIVLDAGADAPRWRASRAPSVAVRAEFTPDGTRVVTGHVDGRVTVWDAESGRELASVRPHPDWVVGIAASPDGRRIATASKDRTARILDLASGETLRVLSDAGSSVQGIAFSPDGRWIATGHYDHTIWIWDAESGAPRRVLHGHEGPVQALAFSPDGSRLASASSDATVRLWNAGPARDALALAGHAGPIGSVASSADGRLLATACDDGAARVFDAATGERRATCAGHSKPVVAASFRRDGARLATASLDGTVRLWDAASGRELRTLRSPSSFAWCADFSPDGARVATAEDDGRVALWDAETGALLAERRHPGAVLECRFDPTGRELLAVLDSDSVLSWDGSERDLAARWTRGPRWEGLSLRNARNVVVGLNAFLALDASGRFAATNDEDWVLRVWERATGGPVACLRGHEQTPRTAVFSPDGAWLASTSDDLTTRIWSVASGEEIATIRSPRPLAGALFAAGGERVVTVDRDGGLRAWPLDPLRDALARRPRALTPEERARFGVDVAEPLGPGDADASASAPAAGALEAVTARR